jgi:hypothetical protein
MESLRRYHMFVSDNIRWEGFEFRPGDIVIATPVKCGTTWMQMLCALLIFDTVDLPAPLSELSPWLDMLTIPLDEVKASLEAQEHRRFIKTHTPLDGVPFDERVSYVCVGRDPRDVSISWDHHMANMDLQTFVDVRVGAVGADDVAELGPPPMPRPDDPVERFWQWADSEDVESVGGSLRGLLDHLGGFWARRELPNVHLFHYSDLKADLPGQMKRLADAVGIEVSEARVAELAKAATFDQMRARADDLVPNRRAGFWKSNTDFFHQGSSGQWADRVDADGIARYWDRVAECAAPDLAAWAHGGWLGDDVQ